MAGLFEGPDSNVGMAEGFRLAVPDFLGMARGFAVICREDCQEHEGLGFQRTSSTQFMRAVFLRGDRFSLLTRSGLLTDGLMVESLAWKSSRSSRGGERRFNSAIAMRGGVRGFLLRLVRGCRRLWKRPRGWRARRIGGGGERKFLMRLRRRRVFQRVLCR